MAPSGSTKEAISRFAPSFSVHSRLIGSVPTEDALEKAKADKDIGVVLMTEKLINMCKQTVYDMKLNSTKPLIVEIPDRHGTSDISKSIDGYVRDAIGLKL